MEVADIIPYDNPAVSGFQQAAMKGPAIAQHQIQLAADERRQAFGNVRRSDAK